MRRTSSALVLAACTLLGQVNTSSAQSAPYRPQRFDYQSDELYEKSLRYDLDYLESMFLVANLSFDTVAGSRERFRAELAQLRGRLPGLSYGQFVMGISKAVAAADDGHTSVIWEGLRSAPIRVAWFGDELRIVMTTAAQQKLLGARILAIADRPVDAILATMSQYIPGSDERVKAQSVQLFSSPDALHGMGVLTSPERLPLTLRLANGARHAVVLEPRVAPERAGRMPWQDVVPTHSLRPAGWLHVLDELSNLPVYLQEGDRFYGVAQQPGLENVFYYRARVTRDQDTAIVAAGGSVKTPTMPLREDLLINGIGAMAERQQPFAHAIIDFRYNYGGNYFNFVEFAQALPGLLAPDARVFIITNNHTFSAAIAATALLKHYAQGAGVIIGERVGDRDKFWAETVPITLPASGLSVKAARGYHDWATGCKAAAEAPCWGINRVLSVPAGSLAPDVEVVTTFADYVAGRDPVIEKIRSLIGS
jgi:hypothetical protein